MFAARRLEADSVALLFAVRESEGSFDAPGLEQLRVGPLDAECSRRLVVDHAPTPLRQHVLERLIEESAGNALALVELPGSLSERERSGADPLPESLPLARGLERAFARTLEQFSPDEREVLLLAAVGVADPLSVFVALLSPVGLIRRAWKRPRMLG